VLTQKTNKKIEVSDEKLQHVKRSLAEVYYELGINNLPVKLKCGALMVMFKASDYGLN
jgi:hypothetical protein